MARREQSYARKLKKAFNKKFDTPSFSERVKVSLKSKNIEDGNSSR